MRTQAEQLAAVRLRLLLACPRFRALLQETKLSADILAGSLRLYADSADPYSTVRYVWLDWQHQLHAYGGYQTFTQYVEQRRAFEAKVIEETT